MRLPEHNCFYSFFSKILACLCFDCVVVQLWAVVLACKGVAAARLQRQSRARGTEKIMREIKIWVFLVVGHTLFLVPVIQYLSTLFFSSVCNTRPVFNMESSSLSLPSLRQARLHFHMRLNGTLTSGAGKTKDDFSGVRMHFPELKTSFLFLENVYETFLVFFIFKNDSIITIFWSFLHAHRCA